ncbi:MAG: hypothetical protein ABIQ31_04865 [Ferruginibacter sp.]
MPAAVSIYPNWQDFKTILQQLELLEKRKNNLAEILRATAKLQEYLIRAYLMKDSSNTIYILLFLQ